MATLAIQPIRRTGLAPAYVAAAVGGDKFDPSKDTHLHVKNGGGAPITVTIATPKQAIPNVEIDELEVSVPAAGERQIGPFPNSAFAAPADGLASITYSSVTSVTIGAFGLVQP